MARAGVWKIGWVELETDEEAALAVLVIDEEREMMESRAIAKSDVAGGLRALISEIAEEVGRPRKISAQTGEIARALRAAGVREEIVVARSEIVEEMLEMLTASFESGEPHFFGGDGVTEEHVRAFFEAAARLVEAWPWGTFEALDSFGVSAEALGAVESEVALMGFEDLEADEQDDEEEAVSVGWLLTYSMEDFEALLETMTSESADASARIDALSVSFEEAEELPFDVDALVRELGLRLADRSSVPMITRSRRGEGRVAPSAKDYELATAICEALAELTQIFMEEEPEEGWAGVEIETASGAKVIVEGPLGGDEDEDGEEDDEDEGGGGEDEDGEEDEGGGGENAP